MTPSASHKEHLPDEPMVHWHWLSFSQLSIDQLYDILVLRQKVFIVEQHCPYLDADGVDQHSWHLLGRDHTGSLIAYLRLVPPGHRFEEPSIGRVITDTSVRGKGLGRVLMAEGIRKAEEVFPGRPIYLSAQRYLERFYGEFDFDIIGAPYKEDGIPHVNMVRSCSQST